MRVVYLDHTAALSGGELALARLLSALEDVDTHVILGEDGPLVKKLEQAGVSVEVFPLAAVDEDPQPARRRLRSPLPESTRRSAMLYAVRLAGRIRRLAPDLVHTNSLKAALYGGVAGRIARVPVVWHVRDRIAADYLGERATAIVRTAARTLPTAVIANSESTLAVIGVDGWVIPSPIDPSLGSTAEDRRAVHSRHGGPHRALEGAACVHRRVRAARFPTDPERAIIVGAPMFGEDDRAYEREVRALADKLGLDGRVQVHGVRR